MIRIDADLLASVGLESLPVWEKNLLLNHIYETLQQRVGISLADRMSNEQLDEFEEFFERQDDDGAFSWLKENFSDYEKIVEREFDVLRDELIDGAGAILGYSRRGRIGRRSSSDPREEAGEAMPPDAGGVMSASDGPPRRLPRG
jgi:hypothetical protein